MSKRTTPPINLALIYVAARVAGTTHTLKRTAMQPRVSSAKR